MTGEAARFLTRFAAAVAICAWVGGFMVYGGIVVPILDDALGHFDAGMITRRVTNGLNAIGVVAVASGAGVAWVDRRLGTHIERALRLGLLILSAASLATLAGLHAEMDRRLDSVGLRGFRPYHRAYLIVSTGQWLANLGLIALTVRIWTRSRCDSAPLISSETRKDHA